MHERSLVKGLIEQVLEEGRTRGLGRIHEIQLQIGEFSGVEPRLVEIAFAEMATEYWDSEIRLIVDVVPLAAVCRTCRADFPVQGFRFLCPVCGCGDVDVTSGEEMRLSSVRAEKQRSVQCEEVKV
jgi:hydrogenase nickel incorporation protein HypA/HybF